MREEMKKKNRWINKWVNEVDEYECRDKLMKNGK